MRSATIVLAVAFALAGIVLAPAAHAAPPDIPEDSCGYFHWHNGNVLQGTLPGYHYHHCY